MESILQDIKNLLQKPSSKDQQQIVISSNKTDFYTRFSPSISLSENKKYEIALMNITSYNSIPNIDASNNLFRYSHDSGTTWTDIILPIGSYELTNINSYIIAKMKANNHYDTTNSKANITLEANNNTLRCILTLATNYQVDFTPANSLATMLGFNSQIYTASGEAPNRVDIMSTSSILVHCSNIAGSYLNGFKEPVLYSFSMNVSPGYKFVEAPVNLVHLPLTTNVIDELHIRLSDQNGKTIDLRNEIVTIRLHIREI